MWQADASRVTNTGFEGFEGETVIRYLINRAPEPLSKELFVPEVQVRRGARQSR